MNWKLRLQNKTTLMTIIVAVISLVYQILAIFDIVPGVTEETILSIAGVVINMLCLLGIVVDPTTKGIADSERALNYTAPAGNGEDMPSD